MMFFGTYWAFCEFMIWQVGTLEGAWFWLKASSFWPFAVAFTLHFVLIFTRPEQYNRYPVLSLAWTYLPPAVITGILLSTDWIYTMVSLPGAGYAYLPVQDSLAYPLEAAYILVMMLIAVRGIYVYWRQATTQKIKNQALLLCAGLSAVIFFGSLSGFILPAFAIHVPNLVFIGIVIFSVTITIAIRKHELFVLSPTTAVPEILRAMPDAMILADTNGTIISTNESAGRLFGFDDSSLPGKTVSACIPEQVFSQIRETLLDKGIVTDLETIPTCAESRVVSIAGSVVRDPHGDPAGMVLIVRDITDRKAAENALQVAGRKISLLTQVTRHDINNLISALAGYILLIKDSPDDPEKDSYLSACMEIVERISNQLRFTREYQDIGSHQPAWLDLGAAISQAQNDLPYGDITVSSDLIRADIFADPMIVKVFYNILENSLRHGKHISRIRIAAGPQDDKNLRIVIEDNGAGIPADEKELIFRYGFGSNTGLGLAVSRDILSLTGITITETGEPGAGARFEIVVPAPSWRPHNQ